MLINHKVLYFLILNLKKNKPSQLCVIGICFILLAQKRERFSMATYLEASESKDSKYEAHVHNTSLPIFMADITNRLRHSY